MFRFTILLSVLLGSCASQLLQIDADKAAEVSALSYGTGGALEREALGKTPLAADIDRVQGKLLELQAEGKKPFYLFVSKPNADEYKLQIKLEDQPSQLNKSETASPTQSINRVMRMLLKSYQSLVMNDGAAAIAFANQAATAYPEISAPYILEGMALIQTGKSDEARVAFGKAKALEPDNNEIDEFLKAIP